MAKHRVWIVAFSPDDATAVAKHVFRDDPGFPIFSDSDHSATRSLGLSHPHAIVHRTFYVLGIPFGVPTGFEELAIPTTMLVDDGVIRWIDHAEDYRLRSDNERIMAAVQQVFGGAGDGRN